MAFTPERIRHLIEAGLRPSSAGVFGRLGVDSIDLEAAAGHGLDLHELALLIEATGFPFDTVAVLRVNGVPDSYIRANCEVNETGQALHKPNVHIPRTIFRHWVRDETGTTYPEEYLSELYMTSL